MSRTCSVRTSSAEFAFSIKSSILSVLHFALSCITDRVHSALHSTFWMMHGPTFHLQLHSRCPQVPSRQGPDPRPVLPGPRPPRGRRRGQSGAQQVQRLGGVVLRGAGEAPHAAGGRAAGALSGPLYTWCIVMQFVVGQFVVREVHLPALKAAGRRGCSRSQGAP